jgi:hypothetical protein
MTVVMLAWHRRLPATQRYHLAPWPRAREGLGASLSTLCDRPVIDPAVAKSPEARVPFRNLPQLLENVARETGNDALGAQIGATFQSWGLASHGAPAN